MFQVSSSRREYKVRVFAQGEIATPNVDLCSTQVKEYPAFTTLKHNRYSTSSGTPRPAARDLRLPRDLRLRSPRRAASLGIAPSRALGICDNDNSIFTPASAGSATVRHLRAGKVARHLRKAEACRAFALHTSIFRLLHAGVSFSDKSLSDKSLSDLSGKGSLPQLRRDRRRY